MALSNKTADNHVEQVTASMHSNEWNDEKKTDLDHARELRQTYVTGSVEEKKLLRKLDWRLIVCEGARGMTLTNAE